MPTSLGTRAQVALVVVLFLGSLAVLLFNTFSALALLGSGREAEVRARLREASRRMAEAAAPVSEPLVEGARGGTAGVDRQLRTIASQTLAQLPGIEGGFYLAGDDRFAAYAFPTRGDGAGAPSGSDPPPLEAPYIRV